MSYLPQKSVKSFIYLPHKYDLAYFWIENMCKVYYIHPLRIYIQYTHTYIYVNIEAITREHDLYLASIIIKVLFSPGAVGLYITMYILPRSF